MSTGAPQKSALKSQTKHAGNVGEVKTIASAAQFCLESFDTCLVIAEDLGPRNFALIENQLGRLSLWISNIGVFALDRASIDYRLRDVPDTHRLVKGLVEVLNGNLQKCIPRLETLINLVATPSKTSAEQIETESSALEAVVQRAADDISLLYQLSNTIRKAGRESQNSKAISLFEIQDAEGNNIEKILEERFQHKLMDKFPGCDEQLRQRLAYTVLLRRKRILYRRSRRPKTPATRLPIVPEPEVLQISATQRSINPVEIKQQETGPAETHTLKRKPSMVRSQARTTKTTTTLDPEKLRPPIAPSVLSVAKTIPLDSHDDLVFPPPPRAAVLQHFHELKAKRRARHWARLQALPNFELYCAYEGKPPSLSAEDVLTLQMQIKEAEKDLQISIDADLKMCKTTETEVLCPYCLCALSSTEMQSSSKWRNHLRGDLDAYVCLFQDCEKPFELYSHSETWLKHMRQHAVRWHCMAKSHGPQTFGRSDEYEQHLREAHEGVFSESQILVMAERNARMIGPLFQSCPLCGITKDHPTVTGRLEDHVVGHLRYLALSSLPYIEEEEQNTNSTDSLRSDDSAKPADRSTVHDFMDEQSDLTSEGRRTIILSGPSEISSIKEPFAEWGIGNYVRRTHEVSHGEPPSQESTISTLNFPYPWIPESRNGDESYFQCSDDSYRFVDPDDISGVFPNRSAQWGYIPKMVFTYEDQEDDHVLQAFRQRTLSNTLETDPTASRATSASASGPHPVRQQILQKLKSATFSPNYFPSFVPVDTLTQLIGVETVSMALAEAGRHDLSSEKYTTIASSLPRVFATLLLIGKIDAILEFEQRGFTDNILPLINVDKPPDFEAWYTAICPLHSKLDYRPVDIHPVSKCFRNPKLWTSDDFERFYESQWLFCAPFFYAEKFEYALAPQCPLPITSFTSHGSGEALPVGLRAYTASIHPSHLSQQNILGTNHLEVVIKMLEPDSNDREKKASDNDETTAYVTEPEHLSQAFLDECDLLYAMRVINHDHVLGAIAAFTRGDQCGFIIPRARGSLREFCETHDPTDDGPGKMIPWLLSQLIGLADGLAKLHKHHGALTPDNILWFPGQDSPSDPDTRSLGVLKIGDVGLTKPLSEGENTGKVSWAGNRYMARDRPRSRAADTWSLGLIFFEFVIWLIHGDREVEEFRSMTSKVHLSNDDDFNFEVWSSRLMNDQRCLRGTPLGAVVQFIVRRLLVQSLGFLENTDRPGRATASEFHSWVSQVRSTVRESGSSYTAVQQDLLELPPPWLYKQDDLESTSKLFDDLESTPELSDNLESTSELSDNLESISALFEISDEEPSPEAPASVRREQESRG